MTLRTTARVFRRTEQPTIDSPTVTAWQVLDTPEVPNLSMSFMTKKPSEGHLSKATHCDLAYMVAAGEGYALIDGQKHPMKKGDVLYAPQGSEYYLSDGMEIIVACNPRFGSKS